MADQVINYHNPGAENRGNFLVIKQVSWAAVFAGVLVALAVEVLFLSFGFFIGFRLSPGSASLWSKIWYWIGCFFSLMAGGWVAARLSGNPVHGKVHGIVTWGLATVTTFVFLTVVSWGVVSQSLGLMQTAAVATSSATTNANRVAASTADRLQNQAAAAINQAQNQPYATQTIAHDTSVVSLVLWIGLMIAACGSLVGGAIGAPKIVPPEA
ncbi:MAG TPA: hypothetical protein VJ732_18700 [Bryobacteraceae bacterium]|nr:hypothetical protein [Bryobacteraceae bacterium]